MHISNTRCKLLVCTKVVYISVVEGQSGPTMRYACTNDYHMYMHLVGQRGPQMYCISLKPLSAPEVEMRVDEWS